MVVRVPVGAHILLVEQLLTMELFPLALVYPHLRGYWMRVVVATTARASAIRAHLMVL